MGTGAIVVPAPNRSVYRDPARVLTGVLAPWEKTTLLWLAGKLPAWVSSDHLTALALLAMMAAGLSYWLAASHPAGLVLATVGLALNWFGDSLDGTLARVRHCERPRYGFYVDHIVDTAGVLCLVGGLGLSGYMSPVVAFGLLIAYYAVSIEVCLAAQALGIFRISCFMVGPTELRLILAIGNLTLLVHPRASLFGAEYLLFDAGGIVAMAGMGLVFVVSAVRHAVELYRAEPLPGRART
jgi:archaetidylinositol phosphate synthase